MQPVINGQILTIARDDSGLDVHILAVLNFTPELNWLASGGAHGVAIISQLPLRKGLDKLLLFPLVQRVPVPAQGAPRHLRKIETSEDQFTRALRQPVRLKFRARNVGDDRHKIIDGSA